MGNVQLDLMYDAVARMKYGMTVTEAKGKGICIKCKQEVSLLDSEYENFALCPDCSTKAKSNGQSRNSEAELQK